VKTLQDAVVAGKTALIRVDYNVPLTDDDQIADDSRIKATLPTINYLLEKGAKKVFLVSHMGRPGGKPVPELSLKPAQTRLHELLGRTDVTLLENLRFDPGEDANSAEFAQKLIDQTGAQIFVQDAFAVLHRKSATTDAITKLLPSYAGLLVEKELETLSTLLDEPTRPFVAVIGGAKIADKVGFIKKLAQKADKILIGGAMANTFLKFQGLSLGKSIVEDNQTAVIKQIYDIAGDKIVLPTDVIVADEINEDANVLQKSVDNILDYEIALDIGPETIANYAKIIESAKTILWNGNMGYSEINRFSGGTAGLATAIGNSPQATTVVGGGDTAGFVQNYQKTHPNLHYSLISTGGGATLAFIAGEELPGLKALT
jgi:phosphoglycerate kinase